MKNTSHFGKIVPFFILILMTIVTIPMGFYGMYLYIAPSLPDISTLKKAPLLKPMQVYTSDNELIAEYGDKLSLPVEYKDIPQSFIHAFLAAEDSSFFEHGGISFKSLGRAASETVTGSTTQTGGSTITMQVAKNYYLSPERTFRRKITEIFLARHIEENLSKEEILTLYVNKIFLGKNAYGIAAAAQIYYSKQLNELTLAQMAMLAGLPKAPSKYNPVNNPERALERRNWILGRMLQLAYITQEQYNQAVAEPIGLNMPNRTVNTRFPYVSELVRNELVKNFGNHAIDSGYKVYTTIDSVRQAYAEDAIQKGLESYDRRHGWRGPEDHDKPLENFIPYANTYPAKVTKVMAGSFTAEMQDGSTVTVHRSAMPSYLYRNANAVAVVRSVAQLVKVKDIVRLRPNEDRTAWSLVQVPKVQGELIAIHPNNGAVLAVVGGYNYYHSKFNRATQGWRQPGSIIKPFVYALALERGMTPHSLISDNQIRIGSWSPKNADGRYLGMMPLRRALYLSRNTVSVRLLQMVGLERTRQLFMDFGLHDEQIPRNYTIALGTPQVLPIQMATGYATIANGGYRVQPYFIERIEDVNGKVIFKANPEYACISCIDENKKINNMVLKQFAKEQAEQETEQEEKSDKDNAKTDKAKPATENAKENTVKEQEKSDKVDIKEDYRQAHRILKSSSAYEMANILRDVIRVGTGKAALKIGRSDLGGKTGTTNDAKDAWFAGFNGQIVTVVWVGFDQPSTLGRREYGGIAALPIWSSFMSRSLEGTPSSWVRFDRNAKDPIFHQEKEKLAAAANKKAEEEAEDSSNAPPLAYRLYGVSGAMPSASTATSSSSAMAAAPAPKPRPRPSTSDFDDLPGQEIPEISPRRAQARPEKTEQRTERTEQRAERTEQRTTERRSQQQQEPQREKKTPTREQQPASESKPKPQPQPKSQPKPSANDEREPDVNLENLLDGNM